MDKYTVEQTYRDQFLVPCACTRSSRDQCTNNRETCRDRLIIAPCKDATEPTKSKCRLHHSRRTVAVRVDSATQSHALAAHSRSDGERSPDQERLLPTPSSVTRLCFRPTDETYPETYRYLCVYLQESQSDQPTNQLPTANHATPVPPRY